MAPGMGFSSTSATPRLTQQWCVQVRCCQRPALGSTRHRETSAARACGSARESGGRIGDRGECAPPKQRRLQRSPEPKPAQAGCTSAGFPADPTPPLGGGELGAESCDAELAPHLIPGHSRFGVVEMARPALVEFGAEGRVGRQSPITGLVIEAVPEGNRQGQPLVLGQLQQVRHGRHRHHTQRGTHCRHGQKVARGTGEMEAISNCSATDLPGNSQPGPNARRGPADAGQGAHRQRDQLSTPMGRDALRWRPAISGPDACGPGERPPWPCPQRSRLPSSSSIEQPN